MVLRDKVFEGVSDREGAGSQIDALTFAGRCTRMIEEGKKNEE